MHNKLSSAIKVANQKSLLSKTALLTSSAAFALLGFAAQVSAQAPAAEAEEIVVTGIRGALKNAIDIKRNATSAVDAVSAEDVGKFPDKNVAESLGRIPGVTVAGQFGEGDSVSIRGASNQFTLTTLNGENVSSTGWYSQQAIDRSFNYSMLPSELIAGMEVHKSSQADLVEGGVGGTVNVKTRKPLDLDANAVFIGLKGTYSTGSAKTDPEASGLYSFKNDSESFGILIAAAKSDYSLVRRGFEGLPSWGGRVSVDNFNQKKERTAFDITAQFKPTDALEFGATYLDLKLKADGTNTAAWIPATNCELNAQGTPIYCNSTGGAAGQTFWDVRPRLATMTSKTADVWGTFTGEGVKAELRAGQSKAAGGTDFETNVAYLNTSSNTNGVINARGDVVKFVGDYNMSVAQLPTKSALANGSTNTPGNGYAGWEGLQTGANIRSPSDDKENYFQGDLTFDVNAGAIKSIKAGARFTNHDVSTTQDKALFFDKGFVPTVATPVDPKAFNGGMESTLHNASEYANGTLTAGNGQYITIPAPNSAAMIKYAKSKIVSWAEDRSSYATINEKNTSVYVMANYEAEAVRGNFGFRYVSTDASSDYYAPKLYAADPSGLATNKNYASTLSTDEASYHDVLPSFNVAFDLADDLILRASAAKVITRANYNDMFARTSIAGYQDNVPNNNSTTKGSIGLLPFTSNQADVGVEWYFSEGSIASLAYFTKSIANFTTASTVSGVSIGVNDPDNSVANADKWTVNSKKNGNQGSIDGIEFQLQHTWDSGFGGVFNYTYADASADASNYADHNGVLSDSSKNSINLVGFYENDTFSARAAYNWRSAYMIRETGFYSNREAQAFGTLDASFSYKVTDWATLTFDATNLLKEDSVQVGRDRGVTSVTDRTAYGYPEASYEGESRYTVGVNFKF